MTRPARVERDRAVRKPRPVVAVAIAVSGEDRADAAAEWLLRFRDNRRAAKAG